MDACDLLPVIRLSKAESKLGNALRFSTGDDLERFNNTWDRLVLEPRVFTFGVFTDDAEIDVVVTCLVTGDVLDEDDGGINVEFLA